MTTPAIRGARPHRRRGPTAKKRRQLRAWVRALCRGIALAAEAARALTRKTRAAVAP